MQRIINGRAVSYLETLALTESFCKPAALVRLIEQLAASATSGTTTTATADAESDDVDYIKASIEDEVLFNMAAAHALLSPEFYAVYINDTLALSGRSPLPLFPTRERENVLTTRGSSPLTTAVHFDLPRVVTALL